MKKQQLLLIVLVLSLSVLGCTKKNQQTVSNHSNNGVKQSVSKNKQYGNIHFGLVTGTGGVHDQSFNEDAWIGLAKLHNDYGVNTTYIESQKQSDLLTNLEIFANQHKDIVLCTGYTFANAIAQVSKQYPKQKFVIVDYSMPQGKYPNVVSIKFQAEQASFLAGYLAAMKTKTGIVGFVGGIQSPVIDHFQYGYEAGVAYGRSLLHKKIKIYTQDIGSFTDLAKDKSSAEAMYDKGADIIFSAAGAAGNGAIVAAQEKNKWVIGVDQDQSYLAPKNVLTSVLKRVGTAVYSLGRDYLLQHNFVGGTTINLGLKNGAVALVTSPYISHEEQLNLDKAKKLITTGKLHPPKNKKGYVAFVKNLQ